jgi:hypothetical protein
MEERQHYWTIPDALYEDDRLSYSDKFLVALIDRLDNEEHCWATNEYLAKRLRKTEQQVANSLTKLRKAGWVRDVSVPFETSRCLTTPLRAHREELKALHNGLTNFGKGADDLTNFGNEDLTNFGKEYKSEELVSEKKREEESLPHPALQIYQEYFPDNPLSCFQQDQVLDAVKGGSVGLWSASCKHWKTGNWSVRNLPGLLDMHMRKIEEQKKPVLSKDRVVPDEGCPGCRSLTLCPYHGNKEMNGTNGKQSAT